MIVREGSDQRHFAVITLWSLVLGALIGCRREKKGEEFVVDLTFKQYVSGQQSRQIVAPAYPNHGTPMFFPTLSLYDRDGRLLYSRNPMQTPSDALSRVAQDVSKLKPLENSPTLKTLINIYKEEVHGGTELLTRHKPTLVSVSLRSCEACSVRAEELAGAKDRILKQDIDILDIQVASPR
jgi:hypothetical protein